MSNLVLAKKSPKPNRNPNLNPNRNPNPNRFQDFSQKLFSPTGIAVMASVGIHGALAIALPYLGNSSEQKPAPKTVELVQLSPAEQSRLPQTAPLPPLGLNQLDGLNPIPGLSTPYPPLPGLGLPSDLSISNPPLNGLANNTTSPTTKTTPSTKTDPKTDPKTDKTKPQADKNTKITGLQLAPSQGPVRIQPSNQREKFSSGGGLPNLNLTAADYGPVSPPPPPPTLYPPAPTGNQTAASVAPPSQSSSLPEFSNQQQARGNNSRTPEPLVSPNIIGSNSSSPDKPSSPSQELVGIKPATGTPPLPTPQLKPNGADGGTGTSNDDYQRRTIDQLASMGKIGGLEKYATISGSYPAGACVNKLSGTTIVTAQVDSQGTVGDTAVTVPSSSPIFDDAAQMAVSVINFGAKGKPMAYQVPVEFKYDPGACGNAAVPKEKETDQTRTSAPTIKPEPSNTATPQSSPAPKK